MAIQKSRYIWNIESHNYIFGMVRLTLRLNLHFLFY